MSTVSGSTILERAERHGWPQAIISGGVISSETGWRREARLPGNRYSLAAQLDQLEEQHARSVAIEERLAADDARRAEARQYDPDLAEEVRAEAAADLARHEAERPVRIEARLGEILSELRSIAGALTKR